MKRHKGRYSPKKNNKQWLTVLMVVEVLALIAMAVFLISSCQKEPISEETLPPEQTTLPAQTTETPITETTAPETESSTVPTTLPAETEPVETEPEETEPPETVPPMKPTSPQKPTEPEVPPITFPYVIPDTQLVIRYLDSYSGIFIEDGSDVEANNITAMVVTNLSNTHIEYANITMNRDGRVLTFSLSALPAGATVVVQEANATPYTDGKYTDCWCELAELEVFEMSEDLVSVEENGDGALVVTNVTDKTIPTIRIFYKFYMSDEDVYVGGITYTARIQDLPAGASSIVTPSHYMPGASVVIMVRTYDTVN